ncbi:MAG: MotA/TolQ/ExbB proton channel family protein [Verrucomicrobiota bacterium]|nr:MotA/TolQ/ExbB proton channel family protein [Verrucomicrobiota bacterium]
MWETLNETVFNTWISGGPLMIGLAALALVIYGSILQVMIYLRRLRELSKDVNEWGHWVEHPKDASGLLGNMIRYTQRDVDSHKELSFRFLMLHRRIIQPLDRQIRFSTTIVSAAPLLGLLGTVVGMLATFLGLSVSYGGNSLDLVAGGISEALITTQTGLMLAIPAMFFLTSARAQRQNLQQFLTQLEAKTLKQFEGKGLKG